MLAQAWSAPNGHEWRLHFIARPGTGTTGERAELAARGPGTPLRWRYDDEGDHPADMLVLRSVTGRLELAGIVDLQQAAAPCTVDCMEW